MKPAPYLLLLPALALGQADWSRIHPRLVGYDSAYFFPGSYSPMARYGSDLFLSGKYMDNGFHTASSFANHYARLRVTAAETTLTVIKKNWWHNLTPGNGETTRDSSINLMEPTPPNRKAMFTVAGNYLYQVSGQNSRFDPRRTFQPSGVNVATDEITLDGTGSPVTPYTHLDEVSLATTGTLPGGLSTGTAYFILRVSGTTLKLASSVANARAGIVVDLTSTGTGVDSLIRAENNPSDLWRLNLDSTASDYAAWTQLFPPAATTYRMGNYNGLSLVWDAYRDRILASNLTAQSYGSKRTWTLDLPTTTWSEGSQSVGAATAPDAHSAQQMTFNTRDSTAWLFGAGAYDVGGNELWKYQPSSGTWTQLTPVSPRPSVRTFHCVAYVEGETASDDVLFVTGGTSDGVSRRDSWVYHIQSNTWDSLEVSTLPTGGYGACQWEPYSGRIVLQVDTTFWVYPIGATDTTTVVAITSPTDGLLTNQGSVTVAWEVNGVPQTTQTSETLELEGVNLVIRCSGAVCDTITVSRDQTPPAVAITSPQPGAILHDAEIAVAWEVDGVPQGTQLSEELEPGANLIIRGATDAAGNTAYDTVGVTYSLDPPVVVIVSPAHGAELFATPATVSWTVDGVSQTVQVTENLTEGVNQITRQSIYNGGTQSISAAVKVYFDSKREACLDP